MPLSGNFLSPSCKLKEQQEKLLSGIFPKKGAIDPARGGTPDVPDAGQRRTSTDRLQLPPPPENRLKKYVEALRLTKEQGEQTRQILELSWEKDTTLNKDTSGTGDRRPPRLGAQEPNQ